MNIIIILLFMGGAFFFLVGTVGLLRMPDVFCRMHATTKCDTLGAGLILLGLILYRGIDIISVKLLLVLIFVWITNPTAAHIIAKAEYDKEALIDKK
ncbi:monovalent cation/H(+) antiporter subunit G [Alkaliphilus serpentinus]|uniref:Monovalent cation/H(+) antiporter subunit G n=2 Tax=Alkaliphilus serpentinus TaxID=1482731 RepID=A0A833HRP5_9FIRM|nr:monovalent cation/H(+) antiporter subunit G [Alkaliphilus serpentinus]